MGNENINDILAEEYKQEELREEGIKQSYKPNTQSKIYIRPDGLLQAGGIPNDYNEKNAMKEEIKELNKMMGD